jgi:hypothetical protein
METAMTAAFEITTDWVRLPDVSPEEAACGAWLGVRHGGLWLTECLDSFADGIRRDAPLLSAYPLAEWMAWNWWRLRWEPRNTRAPGWGLAHRMRSIGQGYEWPGITVWSDGTRVTSVARPTEPTPPPSVRYIASGAALLPATAFEAAVDAFIGRVLGRLREDGLTDTNLHRIWSDVQAERGDPNRAARRRLEALLGTDPDEGESWMIDRLVQDAISLGSEAVDELAADHGGTRSRLMTRQDVEEAARSFGFDVADQDRARLGNAVENTVRADVPAWKVGEEAARALRRQESLGDDPLSDERLAELAGVSCSSLTNGNRVGPMSFRLGGEDGNGGASAQVVLRSPRLDNRRFDIARLLGDALMQQRFERLQPATRAYTYRQKAQRAFAAELLAPYSAVEAMLDEEVSDDSVGTVAEYFQVSERVVQTELVNKGRLHRSDLEPDIEAGVEVAA